MLCYFAFKLVSAFAVLVLILIVMEYALLLEKELNVNDEEIRLNPYCNGICSATVCICPMRIWTSCLNPYCNGICSATLFSDVVDNVRCSVLILIVMEYALLLFNTLSK